MLYNKAKKKRVLVVLDRPTVQNRPDPTRFFFFSNARTKHQLSPIFSAEITGADLNSFCRLRATAKANRSRIEWGHFHILLMRKWHFIFACFQYVCSIKSPVLTLFLSFDLIYLIYFSFTNF